MLKGYRGREWDSVMAIIDASRGLADHFGLDGLLELYCERVRAFRENPPRDDSNGVFALQTKSIEEGSGAGGIKARDRRWLF